MPIHRYDVYRSPNIGIFLRGSERLVLVPRGFAPTKLTRLAELLVVEPIPTSLAGSRLLGPLAVMNSHGILVTGLAEDDELQSLRSATRLTVERLQSRYTSAGNLVAANDHGAIVSRLLPSLTVRQVEDVLSVPAEQMTIASYVQIGAMVIASNRGAVVHPDASESEIQQISQVLKVETEPGTVNGGVPYIAAGVVANDRSAIVGTLTTGPELMILSRALKV